MYVYKYSGDIYLLCMIKVSDRWCIYLYICEECYNLGYFDRTVVVVLSPPTPPPFCCFLKLQNTMNELACLAMGTIFLVRELLLPFHGNFK